MENIDSKTVFLAVGTLAVKYRRCSLQQKNIYRKKLIIVTKIYSLWKENERVTKRFWVRDIFREEQRILKGVSTNLIQEMRTRDRDKFINYLRMPETFDALLSIVKPYIEKQNLIRQSIDPRILLELTLRFLASGDCMASMSYNFRVGYQTVSDIIAETCEVIWLCLKDIVFIKPTDENWKAVSKDFETQWNFKHCIGAIYGKHVVIQAPPKSGSRCFNYKGTHSIHLLAIADANYKFIMVDIGAEGRLSDSGVFKDSVMGQGFEQNLFNIPPIEEDLPYVLVGDEAFVLTQYMMRPYPRRGQLDLPKKVFNYRLSRARRIIENAFGILVAKWRIFRRPIVACDSTVRKIVQAAVSLHNFLLMRKLRKGNYSEDLDELVLSGDGLTDMTRTDCNTYSRRSAAIREAFTQYFCGPGAVEWQWAKAVENDY